MGSHRPGVVRAVVADITALEVDAVVNAANDRLQHGGGVAGAIVAAGGAEIQDESDRWVAEHGPVATGEAAVTTAGALPARWVIHVVGPIYRRGADNAGLLTAAVSAALDEARELGARSVAMPAISAGIYGYPRPDATRVIAAAAVAWVRAHPGAVDEVILVGHDPGTTADFEAALKELR